MRDSGRTGEKVQNHEQQASGFELFARRETMSTKMNSLEKTDDSSRHLCAMSQQHFGALFTMLADKPT